MIAHYIKTAECVDLHSPYLLNSPSKLHSVFSLSMEDRGFTRKKHLHQPSTPISVVFGARGRGENHLNGKDIQILSTRSVRVFWARTTASIHSHLTSFRSEVSLGGIGL
ncbi:hypothetical protein CDAR_486111 [Caerostris darwini]|uniref:Ycf15 n=1 Tax=Caerostris darwini TaxID=1538125 RepID=A0AAV4M9Q7_9ARAC|nr:hypothetical protein CDAR_486111 [Caerostris darwini]